MKYLIEWLGQFCLAVLFGTVLVLVDPIKNDEGWRNLAYWGTMVGIAFLLTTSVICFKYTLDQKGK